MAKTVLNAHNITPKENVVMMAVVSITRFNQGYGCTVQGIANVLAGRVGGVSVGVTRRALLTLEYMGYVQHFNIGRTKCWTLTEAGGAYVVNMMSSCTHGYIYKRPVDMFEDEIPF